MKASKTNFNTLIKFIPDSGTEEGSVRMINRQRSCVDIPTNFSHFRRVPRTGIDCEERTARAVRRRAGNLHRRLFRWVV